VANRDVGSVMNFTWLSVTVWVHFFSSEVDVSISLIARLSVA
jgi:hypothetical protein